MAVTDIISEEEIRAPNMEVARGGPEDFMTDDEMDPYQDPEFQQLLESLPMEQAEVLMQLIKEFKAMVAQGFEGEFEDFVKMKMASARGGPEDFQTVDEMQIGPEEEQSIIQTGQQVAQGGRIGYQGGGGPYQDYLQDLNDGIISIDTTFSEWLDNNAPDPDHDLIYAQGGRAGYQYGNQVTADTSGILSQVSPYAEGNKLANDAIDKIFIEFRERFPEASDEDIQQMIRNEIAHMQADAVAATPGLGILGFQESMDMITPESVDTSSQAISRHLWEGDDSRHTAREKRIGKQLGGRPGYGLGSLVKGVFKGVKKGVKGLTKSIKKFAKSDLGKMALMYMATAGMGNILQPGAASWASPFTKGAGTGWLRPGTVFSNYSNLFKGSPEIASKADALTSGSKFAADEAALQAIADNAGATSIGDKAVNTFLSRAGDASTKGGLFSKALGSFAKNPLPWIAGTAGLAGLYTAKNPGKDNIDDLMKKYKGEVKDWDNMIADIRAGKIQTPFSTDNITYPYPFYGQQGGRVGRAEGGLMDLGGLEKDYRAEGGFVPIGGKEKADDVPARLSRNEFVFTADAVRNAGGGDVDRGAEVMENVMTNLEQGGSISEESQGLEGARDMFEVSERLSEVV